MVIKNGSLRGFVIGGFLNVFFGKVNINGFIILRVYSNSIDVGIKIFWAFDCLGLIEVGKSFWL